MFAIKGLAGGGVGSGGCAGQTNERDDNRTTALKQKR